MRMKTQPIYPTIYTGAYPLSPKFKQLIGAGFIQSLQTGTESGVIVWYTVDTLWNIKRGKEITLIGGRTMGTAQRIEPLKSELEYAQNTTVASEEWMEDIAGIECRLPTESLLREARLLNIPRRGFCVSADIEAITTESYRYLIDREEFTAPII